MRVPRPAARMTTASGGWRCRRVGCRSYWLTLGRSASPPARVVTVGRALERAVAGAGGFEPPDAGTKTRCLTTWLRPSATAAGDTARAAGRRRRGGAVSHHGPGAAASAGAGRGSAAARRPGRGARRCRREPPTPRRARLQVGDVTSRGRRGGASALPRRPRRLLVGEEAEHARRRCRSWPRRARPAASRRSLSSPTVGLARHDDAARGRCATSGRQVARRRRPHGARGRAARARGANSAQRRARRPRRASGRPPPCESARSGTAITRCSGSGSCDVLEHLAAAHRELRPGPEEEGHVGADRRGDLVAQPRREVEAEEPLEREQRGGGVGAAAAEPGRRRARACAMVTRTSKRAVQPRLELAHQPARRGCPRRARTSQTTSSPAPGRALDRHRVGERHRHHQRERSRGSRRGAAGPTSSARLSLAGAATSTPCRSAPGSRVCVPASRHRPVPPASPARAPAPQLRRRELLRPRALAAARGRQGAAHVVARQRDAGVRRAGQRVRRASCAAARRRAAPAASIGRVLGPSGSPLRAAARR